MTLSKWHSLLTLVAAGLFLSADIARGQESFARQADQVNRKMVKVFGSGGYRGLAAYGTGVVVSPQGYILTIASHLLDTPDLRVHLYDGRHLHAKVIVVEPALDAALIKIDDEKLDPLPYFDLAQVARRPIGQTGDWILAFSNQFEIATRDEPMSIQHGVIAAYAKLDARRGVHEAPYAGEVYILDAITNNPGAGGGALTNRKGELLGLLGKELRNSRSETWVNYAVPIHALTTFVEEAKTGKYKLKPRREKLAAGGYHGIVLVANPIQDRTPPFVEEVVPGSPAAKAGLKSDDLIVYVDGAKVVSVEEMQKILTTTRPGDELKLEIRRVDRSVDGSGDRLMTVRLKMAQPVARGPKKK